MNLTAARLALTALTANIGRIMKSGETGDFKDKSACFIRDYQTCFPETLTRENHKGEDGLLQLMSGYLSPHTPLQNILNVAWHAALGNLCIGAEPSCPSLDEKRLLPIAERILCTKSQTRFEYPLARLSADSIFPREKKSSTEHETGTLLREFESCLARLEHTKESESLWFEHFNGLMTEFFSLLPLRLSSENTQDIPVYDHAKVWAAFSAALYIYHESEDPGFKSLQDRDSQKFLIATGNFYGIQDFIFKGYGESGKRRSKLLRGRSFYVSLLSELAADMILNAFALPVTSVVTNAAGKFTILLPTTQNAADKLSHVGKIINNWLVDISFGETAFGISATPAALKDFDTENIPALLDRVEADAQYKKFTRLDLRDYKDRHNNYLDRFNTDFTQVVCSVCGKRPSRHHPHEIKNMKLEKAVCSLCRDHMFIGTYLVAEKEEIPQNHLFEKIFSDGITDHSGYDLELSGRIIRVRRDGKVVKSWMPDAGQEELPMQTIKRISGYVPLHGEKTPPEERSKIQSAPDAGELEAEEMRAGQVMSFNYLACMARSLQGDNVGGTAALGVVKADIDDLGLIMSCGISTGLNLSTMAAFSRQMNDFFTIFLPKLLQVRYRYAYTVFAGGDDLFMIGPWDDIINLAGDLDREFNRYCCHNTGMHLSAGVILCKPGTAVDTMAQGAEKALEQSKTGSKAKVTIFNETRHWKDLSGLQDVFKKLNEWMDTGLINRAMLYRINELIPMVTAEQALTAETSLRLKDLDCTRWRYLLAYTLNRNINRKDNEQSKELTAMLTKWLQTYQGAMKIPLWRVLYNLR